MPEGLNADVSSEIRALAARVGLEAFPRTQACEQTDAWVDEEEDHGIDEQNDA